MPVFAPCFDTHVAETEHWVEAQQGCKWNNLVRFAVVNPQSINFCLLHPLTSIFFIPRKSLRGNSVIRQQYYACSFQLEHQEILKLRATLETARVRRIFDVELLTGRL